MQQSQDFQSAISDELCDLRSGVLEKMDPSATVLNRTNGFMHRGSSSRNCLHSLARVTAGSIQREINQLQQEKTNGDQG